MASFASPLPGYNEFRELRESLMRRKGPLAVNGCMEAQKAHLMSELGRQELPVLIVVSGEMRAKELTEDLRAFRKDVSYYPARDLLFYQADLQGNLLTRERVQVIRTLLEGKAGVIVTTVDACMERMMPLGLWRDAAFTIEMDQDLDLAEWKNKLVLAGYERVSSVEQPGQFSVRGGILDIYPLTEETPVRVELFDTVVDSMRFFDAESQRSIENVESITIYPATETPVTEDSLARGVEKIRNSAKKQAKKLKDLDPQAALHLTNMAEEAAESLEEGWKLSSLDAYRPFFADHSESLFDYLPGNCPVFLDEPVRLEERAVAVRTEFSESMTQRLNKGYLLPEQADIMIDVPQLFAMFQRATTVCFSGLEQRTGPIDCTRTYSMTCRNVGTYQNNIDLLIGDLLKYKKEKYRVVLLCPSRTRAERMAAQLMEYDLLSYFSDREDQEVQPGEIAVMAGSLSRGFEYPLIKFAVMTESDMFGREKKKKLRPRYHREDASRIRTFGELTVGDYVIHENHGVGIYRGLEQIEVEHVMKDYIKVEYGDHGNLYIPVTELDRLQKYAGAGAKAPKLNRLGGAEWDKTKTRVRSAVKDIAKDLVNLYAARRDAKGFACGPDTVWQREFEELFPYEPTEDQEAAIAAVKADMESTKIMDRLVCGDVGYGKTEVALRAAFKAIQEGKQVVFLCPTTILAQQHYNTFAQRLMNFPMRVDLLCRFRTPKEQKKTLEDLKRGTVDVVIGTHRVLSKDVQFKDLGLLIIDEEQRFGVTHKEKIKQLKHNVDVITLTATPIPRTLHMSLTGIRDMSLLREPPIDRVPIQTYVMEYNDEMVREAIERELARGGQVYYVHNKVKNISEVAARIQELMPEATVVYAHGQMNERELESVMMDFISGEIDVLVSTTIIETGLDIPNANTIIIQDAENFGLSQLYQLRGRVGRSSRTAYAFLMYTRNKMLKEEAEKRLSAIREFTELGSGVKIAMKDLEIRGAGNVLGAEQSGHMEAVGYDLYCKMLGEAVRELTGEVSEIAAETTIDVDCDAFIPPTYIRNEAQKLDIYKRIASITNEEEYSDMLDELTDRFGDMPRPVKNLLMVALLKAMGQHRGVREIRANRAEVRLHMDPEAPLDVTKIPEWIASYSGALRFQRGTTPAFVYTDRSGRMIQEETMLKTVGKLLGEIKLLPEA